MILKLDTNKENDLRDADGLSRNPLHDKTDLTDAHMDHDAPPVVRFLYIGLSRVPIHYKPQQISNI